MKTFFQSILSISLSFLSLSCGTETESVTSARETAGKPAQIGNSTFTTEQEAPSATFYGTKSVGIAFVLANLN